MQTIYAIVQLRSNNQLENGKLHYNHDLEAKWVQSHEYQSYSIWHSKHV